MEEAKSKSDQINELENKVNNIPSLLEKEYLRGKKEVTAELEKEYKYNTEILKKRFSKYHR